MQLEALNTLQQLQSYEDCIYGRLGFSFTSKNILELTENIYTYCANEGYENIIFGYDYNEWSKTFIHDVMVPKLNKLGFSCFITKTPCPLFQVSWLSNQCSKDYKYKILGLYISTDWYYNNLLNITFRNYLGQPVPQKTLEQILNISSNTYVQEINPFVIPPAPEELEIDLYPNYLTDSKLITKSLHGPVYIDCMFGSTEHVLDDLSKVCSNLNILIRNKGSNPVILKNYTPRPTGEYLKWKINEQTKGTPFYFALSTDGTSLGLWDLKQEIEISPSGIYLILLYFLAVTCKRKGTALLTKGLSDKVLTVAKNLGLRTEIINRNKQEFTTHLTAPKRSAFLVYGDELGRFWFKNDVMDSNSVVALSKVVECCNKYKKSPGEMVDYISSKYLTQEYIYINMLLPSDYKSKEIFESETISYYKEKNQLLYVDTDYTSVLRLNNNIKVSLTNEPKQQCIELFIESPTKELTVSTAEVLKSIFIGEPKNETDHKVDHINSINIAGL